MVGKTGNKLLKIQIHEGKGIQLKILQNLAMYDKFTTREEFVNKVTDTITYEYTDSGTIALGSDVSMPLTASAVPTIGDLSAKTPQQSWTLNAFLNDSTHSVSSEGLQNFSIGLNLTWAISAVTDISYSLETFGNESVPNWVNFDSGNSKISGTAPLLNDNMTYFMTVKSEFDEIVKGNITKIIAIETIGTQSKERISVQTATLITQLAVGTVAVLSIGSFIASGKPSSGLWSFLEQQQIIIMLLMIDSFIPAKIQKYVEGISFVFLNGINLRKPL